ncbi:hypothetical protein [Citrobacter portucalensis]|uniref:hypothetical protein n=1 Tax=Citrobacter portucalensis TaxID=1639133 RepID=UPI000BAA0E58|nr:hypothetical protein [Citrobacter portucalensis]
MNRTDAPSKQPQPFAINGQRDPILDTTPAGDNTASYALGFPPITMILKSAGGLPPKGQDLNQILYELSSICRWFSSGALNTFDSSFSASIGGYPSGSVLISDSGSVIYINTTDSNTTNPNSSGEGWVNLFDFLSLKSAAKADIVGTVSQSGGVPTGVIIEKGSNSNGNYIKFADGTLIFWFTSSISATANNSSGGGTNLYFLNAATFTFPATFIGVKPTVSASGTLSTGSDSSWVVIRGIELTGVSLAIISNMQNAASYLGYMAVGRWF